MNDSRNNYRTLSVFLNTLTMLAGEIKQNLTIRNCSIFVQPLWGIAAWDSPDIAYSSLVLLREPSL